jgi:hypothetical protein
MYCRAWTKAKRVDVYARESRQKGWTAAVILFLIFFCVDTKLHKNFSRRVASAGRIN